MIAFAQNKKTKNKISRIINKELTSSNKTNKI